MSLQEFNLAGNTFAGLDNYINILNPNSLFFTAAVNTTFIALILIPLQVIGGLVIAVLVNSQIIKFAKFWRSLFMMPYVITTTVLGVIFSILLAQNGLINLFLDNLFNITVPWLTDPIMAKISVALASAWRQMGLSFLIYFAGLQAISDSLYEAAEMDGANRFQKFRYITIPQLWPITTVVVILATIQSFRIFAVPFILTQGGPGSSSQTLLTAIYLTAFRQLELGKAAAMGVLLTGVLFVIMFLQYQYGKRKTIA